MKEDRVVVSKVLAGPEFNFEGDVDANLLKTSVIMVMVRSRHTHKVSTNCHGFRSLRLNDLHMVSWHNCGVLVRLYSCPLLQRIDAYNNEAGLHNLLLIHTSRISPEVPLSCSSRNRFGNPAVPVPSLGRGCMIHTVQKFCLQLDPSTT